MALVGLHPSIIMTVCQKALSFWNYQMAQEQAILNSLYQNIVGKLKQLERPHMSDPHPSQEGKLSTTHINNRRWPSF
jgi:hypothetical protein